MIHKYKHIVLVLMLSLVAIVNSSIVHADETGFDERLSDCHEIEINKGLVTALTYIGGYDGSDALPPFVIGISNDEQPEKLILFAKVNDAWHCYFVAESSALVAVKIAPELGRVLVFSMLAVEGPGEQFQILRTDNAFKDVSCSVLRFPGDINKPVWNNEYLELMDFNTGSDGAGALVCSASVERDGKVDEWWYEYRTGDWGRTWSAPRRIEKPAGVLQGVYVDLPEIGEGKTAGLVRELMR